MRTTILNRLTFGVAGVVAALVVALAIGRNAAKTPENVNNGAALFQQHGCARCHHTDSAQALVGPGLEGLFDRETLPATDREANEANVREQLFDPVGTMPSYEGRLTEDEADRIIEYLQTL